MWRCSTHHTQQLYFEGWISWEDLGILGLFRARMLEGLLPNSDRNGKSVTERQKLS